MLDFIIFFSVFILFSGCSTTANDEQATVTVRSYKEVDVGDSYLMEKCETVKRQKLPDNELVTPIKKSKDKGYDI